MSIMSIGRNAFEPQRGDMSIAIRTAGRLSPGGAASYPHSIMYIR